MSDSYPRRTFAKRLFIAAAALTAFTMASIIGARLAVESLFKGIASSKSSGLSALAWDAGSMLHSYQATAGSYDKSGIEPWIARNANVLAHSSDYDRSLASLHQIVTTHHGYLEDLRTESHSGRGRALASIISVPSNEFDATAANQSCWRRPSTSQFFSRRNSQYLFLRGSCPRRLPGVWLADSILGCVTLRPCAFCLASFPSHSRCASRSTLNNFQAEYYCLYPNRHRGSGCPLSPATPPGMRVRTGRFRKVEP